MNISKYMKLYGQSIEGQCISLFITIEGTTEEEENLYCNFSTLWEVRNIDSFNYSELEEAESALENIEATDKEVFEAMNFDMDLLEELIEKWERKLEEERYSIWRA